MHRYERSPEQARAIGLSTGDDEAAEEAATQLVRLRCCAQLALQQAAPAETGPPVRRLRLM